MSGELKRYEREIRKYVRDYDRALVETWRSTVRILTHDKSESAGRKIAVELLGLAVDEQIRGELAVLDLDVNGWARMDLALRYGVWCTRFWGGAARPKGVATWLLQALAFEENEVADELGALLERSAAHDPHVSGSQMLLGEWDLSPVPHFALLLWKCARGLPLPSYDPEFVAPLGDYELVFEHWNEDFAVALEAVCDLHFHECEDRRAYAAFARGMRILAPEVHAIRVVRRSLKLPAPKVEHELLETPLAELPPKDKRPSIAADDELLELLASRGNPYRTSPE